MVVTCFKVQWKYELLNMHTASIVDAVNALMGEVQGRCQEEGELVPISLFPERTEKTERTERRDDIKFM